jgi:endonuclease/exonuclease/phosphatase family metal-dependent hydrolase
MLKIGTFNLNNLFSRFNFKANLADAVVEVSGSTSYKLDRSAVTLRSYKGQVIQAKSRADTDKLVQRITAMDLDVLAVQEVEDIDTLRNFASAELQGRYPYVALVEGNDARLIDVGLLSKLPLGAVTSWQYAVHPSAPDEPIFDRDLLQAEVWNASRTKRLLTVFNTHLKSQYIGWDEQAPGAAAEQAAERRRMQAETIARILDSRMRGSERYVLVGDMNDGVESESLASFGQLGLVNGLASAKETQPGKPEHPGPATAAWTHRYKEPGKPAVHRLFDQLWLSPELAKEAGQGWIGRRKNLAGDGSDHDPAWVEVG